MHPGVHGRAAHLSQKIVVDNEVWSVVRSLLSYGHCIRICKKSKLTDTCVTSATSATTATRATKAARVIKRGELFRISCSDIKMCRGERGGGFMGMAFTVAYCTLRPRVDARIAGVGFGLAIWMCLLGTLILAPHGQEMLFKLTLTTLS